MEYNYFENIVWNANKILLALGIAISVVTVVYALIVNYFENNRRRKLLAIKQNVHALAMSGQKPTGETCLTVDTKTMQAFLDVEMEREQVLFSDTEKQFIRKCFAYPEKIESAKKTAQQTANRWRRIEAILSLGYAGDVSSLEIIKNGALDRNEDVAYYSLLALGLIKNVESGKILLELLKKKVFSPSKVISILESFPPAVADEAAKLMEDNDPVIRFWAGTLVARLGGERHSRKLETLTQDFSTDVRAMACGCLGAIGKKESKDALLKCLKDDSWRVRMNAVKSLSKLAGDETIGQIAGLINEDSLLVKETVKDAMASHIKAALPSIEKILSGGDELARKEAVEAIDISGYLPQLLKDAVSDDPGKKAEAARLLKAMIKASAHFGIEAALAGLSKDQRDKVVGLLQTIDSSFAAHVVKKIKREIAEL